MVLDATAIAPEALPEALAGLHHRTPVGASVTVRLSAADVWPGPRLDDVVIGAGFTPAGPADPGRGGVTMIRELTLADRVAPGMRVLICGLNPSVFSAEAGIGFARPGNRFWPAALAAGLVTIDRDPTAALAHGVGLTDLVKRATPRADALSTDEYRTGLARVTRLVAWLRPGVVCFVGLAGWRVAADRRAMAGWQPQGLAGAAVYLMPSTSGLNAHARLEDLADHLRTAAGHHC